MHAYDERAKIRKSVLACHTTQNEFQNFLLINSGGGLKKIKNGSGFFYNTPMNNENVILKGSF
jgi:hypothetical protein